MLLWRQLEQFLFNGGNAVLSVEHLAELFGKTRHLLVQVRLFLRLQNPSRHIWVLTSLRLQEMLFIGPAPQKSGQKRKPLLFQFFCHIQSGGVVVGDNGYRLSIPNRIGNNIQNGLCLSGTRRSLDNTNLGGKCVLHRCFLALIQSKKDR